MINFDNVIFGFIIGVLFKNTTDIAIIKYEIKHKGGERQNV